MSDARDIPGKRRRQRPRLRVGITSRLETLDGVAHVQLLDLSQTGARLQTQAPGTGRSGILRWLDFEAYGDIVWQDGLFAGLKFDPPLTSETILATRSLAPDIVQDFDPVRDAAKAWTMGHTH
ncbi:hypothetical protein GCM10011515_17390 [Tsuneonella deserti]|uniref:PilZ domain-containing protein n=1 Tax=Tsuneonella deserti TaxID=2035528 RepID=A0ABQ1S7X8_9SPHN|nr:PilZ domain-containing protein [Tsuneonella deserti]GGD98117.1 hypothetical protein GCM10011515_17390 [Tsuneonella deserti]